MKATGIVRRMDDLGRIVIPRDLRKQLRLREGEALEYYVSGNSLVLIPYQRSLANDVNYLLEGLTTELPHKVKLIEQIKQLTKQLLEEDEEKKEEEE